MRIEDVLAGVAVETDVAGSLTIERVTLWPRDVTTGTLFAACRLPWMDRVRATTEAVQRDAAAILIDHADEEVAEAIEGAVPVLRADRVNRSYALACANLYGNAHRNLVLIGVTGTKGKTTTCHLIETALRHAGHRTGLISSLIHRMPDEERPSAVTTPEPSRLHQLLHGMREQGATHVVLEVSSIALAEDRLHGIRFQALGFTNLGCEHWEYHGSPEAYIAAKARLFLDPELHALDDVLCVINTDDPVGAELATHARGRVRTYGSRSGGLNPIALDTSETGTIMRLPRARLSSRLSDEHNTYNLLAAYAIAEQFVSSRRCVADGLQQLEALPGRLERISAEGLDVFVDHAHTPESVEAVLHTFAGHAGHRIRIVVIGCSARSDRGKRSPMGRAALAGSDLVIFTADNPAHEDPLEIIADMVAGLDTEALERESRLRIVPDRAAAIALAIETAPPGGLVFLLGKGSERTQEIGGQLLAFDDRNVAREVLERRRQ